MLAEFRLGELNNQTLVRLADALEALPAPLADLFQKIDLRSKPFWKI